MRWVWYCATAKPPSLGEVALWHPSWFLPQKNARRLYGAHQLNTAALPGIPYQGPPRSAASSGGRRDGNPSPARKGVILRHLCGTGFQPAAGEPRKTMAAYTWEATHSRSRHPVSTIVRPEREHICDERRQNGVVANKVCEVCKTLHLGSVGVWGPRNAPSDSLVTFLLDKKVTSFPHPHNTSSVAYSDTFAWSGCDHCGGADGGWMISAPTTPPPSRHSAAHLSLHRGGCPPTLSIVLFLPPFRNAVQGIGLYFSYKKCAPCKRRASI